MARFAVLISAFILMEAVIASSASAQSVDIPFSGTIPQRCTFSTSSSAMLADGSGKKQFTSVPVGGTSAAINLDCNSPFQYSSSLPQQISGSLKTPSYCYSNLSSPNLNINWGVVDCKLNSAILKATDPGKETTKVNIIVGNDIPRKNHTYKVVVTATPK